MIGYFISGTSVGLLSFQAYKRRQEQKKTDAINELVQENYLSPQDWTEGEDVYSLQSKLLTQKLRSTNDNEGSPQKRYFDKTRSIISKKFLQLRMNQQIMMSKFYKRNSNQNKSQDVQASDSIKNEDLVSQTIKSSTLKNIYQQFESNYKKKNEEKQLKQVKKYIISPNVNKKEGSPQKICLNSIVNPPDQVNIQSKTNSIEQYLEHMNESEDNQKGLYIPINKFENNFNESTIGKKSIIYTEYKGGDPSDALKQFLSKCEQYVPIKNAIIIHYYFGKGDPTSYVLGVEYNPIQNEGISNSINQIDGANLAVLKKTDAYKFNYDFRQIFEQQNMKVQLDKWIEGQQNQKLLKSILEQEIESKIHISGVRQMKYIEVFGLDDSKNIINYQVQVPFGQNESAYDLRSKTQTQEVQYHNTFRQFDIYSEKN